MNTQGYLECASASKKKLQKIIDKELVIGFSRSNMILPMKKLVIKVDHGKRAIFNIKKSLSKMAVLG